MINATPSDPDPFQAVEALVHVRPQRVEVVHDQPPDRRAIRISTVEPTSRLRWRSMAETSGITLASTTAALGSMPVHVSRPGATSRRQTARTVRRRGGPRCARPRSRPGATRGGPRRWPRRSAAACRALAAFPGRPRTPIGAARPSTCTNTTWPSSRLGPVVVAPVAGRRRARDHGAGMVGNPAAVELPAGRQVAQGAERGPLGSLLGRPLLGEFLQRGGGGQVDGRGRAAAGR